MSLLGREHLGPPGAMSGVIWGCEECFQTMSGFLTSPREKTDATFNPFLLWEEPSIWSLRELVKLEKSPAFGPAGLMGAWRPQHWQQGLGRPQQPATCQGPD